MNDVSWQQPGTGGDKPRFWRSRAGFVLLAFLAIAGFFLVLEHRAHLAGVWPWLLLAACPLLHLFMHGGHGGHGPAGDRHKHGG